jgi:hypothetical protein
MRPFISNCRDEVQEADGGRVYNPRKRGFMLPGNDLRQVEGSSVDSV